VPSARTVRGYPPARTGYIYSFSGAYQEDARPTGSLEKWTSAPFR